MKKTLYLLGFMALLVPSLTFASFDVSLKYGSKGDAVSELQDFLQDQNDYSGKIDGQFGLGTLKAVETFQTASNLQADGYFGIQSRAAANTILATILAPSNAAEQSETGTITNTDVNPVLDSQGCSSTSLYSSTTGQSCSSTTSDPKSLVINPQVAQLQQQYTSAELTENLYNIADVSAQAAPYAGGFAYFSSHPTEMAELNTDLGDSTCSMLVGFQGTEEGLTGEANQCIAKLSIAIEQNNQLIQSLASQIESMGGQLPPLPIPETINPIVTTPNSVTQSSNNNNSSTTVATQTPPTPTYTAPIVTVIENPNVGNSIITAGATQQVVGSFTIENQSTIEPVYMNTFEVDISDSTLVHYLGICDGNLWCSSQYDPVHSVNPFGTGRITIPAGGSVTFNVIADAGTTQGTFTTSFLPTVVTGSLSNLVATVTSAQGQTITINQ